MTAPTSPPWTSAYMCMGGEGAGAWESHDRGQTWTQTERPPGLPPSVTQDGGIIAAITDERGVWVTRDGEQWTQVPA